MSDAPLGPALLDYLRARGADAPDLADRRARLLPRVLAEPEAVRDGLECRAALRLLDDVGHAGAPRDALARGAERAARAAVLLVDRESGAARPAELILDVRDRPGAGRVVCAGPCDAAAAQAGADASAAAASWLRRQGHPTEAGDLHITWHVPGVASVDGPSLGLPLALLLARVRSGAPIPAGETATGAIDPHGRVLPVAGVDAKVEAARAAGWTDVLVPPGPAPAPARVVRTLDEALGTEPRRPRSRRWLPLAAALLVAFGVFDALEPAGYAAAFRPADASDVSDQLLLVTWDRSVATPGGTAADFADHRSYRPTHAAVVDRLVEAGAIAIAFDAWIAGAATDGTEPLAAAVRRAAERGVPVLLPSRKGGPDHPWDPPEAALLEAGARTAFSTTIEEGRARLVRSVRVASNAADGPRWGLATELVATDAPPRRTDSDVLAVGGRRVEVRDGRVWPRFPATPAWPTLHYAEVHAGRFDPSAVRGRRVLLGSTQGLDDQHQTPVGRWYGVQIQAAATDALLQGRGIVPVGRGVRALAAAAVATVLLALFRGARGRRRARVLLWTAVVVGGAWLDATWLLTVGRWWPWTDAAAIAVLAAGWQLGARR